VTLPPSSAGLPEAPAGSNLLKADKLKVTTAGLQLKDKAGALVAATGRLPK
jgi:hypothetical protein